MWIALWTTIAAATPCPADVAASATALDKTLDDVEPILRTIIPSLATTRPARGQVSDDGVFVGLGMRNDCVLDDGTAVTVGKANPAPGYGYAAPKLLGYYDDLVVGSHDEARDGWDRIDYLAIVAHEWAHVHHAASDPNASAYVAQFKLEKKYLKKQEIQQAVAAVVQSAATVKDCDFTAVRTDQQALMALFKTKEQTTLRRWAFTEGMGRYIEGQTEAALRGVDSAAILDNSCTSVNNGDFGYALGCSLARAVASCKSDVWKQPWVGPFASYFPK